MKATDIDINDFKIMITIIDACAERGAIKGNEILIVGTLREKLVNAVQISETAQSTKQVDTDLEK